MWDCQQLIGLKVAGMDGQTGRLTDLCFDDDGWVIRYIVVNTVPTAVTQDFLSTRRLDDAIEIEAIDDAAAAENGDVQDTVVDAGLPPGANMRSVEEVRGYRVHATDGEIGRVEGFLIAESSWSIAYVIVEVLTGWEMSKLVLLPSAIRRIDKEQGAVHLGLTSEEVLTAPELIDDLAEAYETTLLKHLSAQGVGQAH